MVTLPAWAVRWRHKVSKLVVEDWQQLKAVATGSAPVLALVGLIFVAFQIYQTQESTRQATKTGQVQYNLQVMERLDDTLLQIGAKGNEKCYHYVWGPRAAIKPDPGSLIMQCGDALLDVLSMAMKAVYCLPGFSSNGTDWREYVDYQFNQSKNLVDRVREHPSWWPELNEAVRLKKQVTDCG
jgi:hypothetical protein